MSLPFHLPMKDESTEFNNYGGIDAPSKLSRTSRTRISLGMVFGLVAGPWALFVLTYMAVASSIHYTTPILTYFAIAAGFIYILCLFFAGIDQQYTQFIMKRDGRPSWMIFITVLFMVAWVSALFIGSINYETYTEKWHDLTKLGIYRGVDPTLSRGEQLMDAGLVAFAPGTSLELNYSMGYLDGSTYCVAPFINGKYPPVTYDFWAIGKDCCKASASGFHCPHVSSRSIRDGMVGLRLMDETEQKYFRLAVQQAEAAYGIVAEHPLFFAYENPLEMGNVSELLKQAQAKFYSLMIDYFFFQCAVVIAALLFNYKMSQN